LVERAFDGICVTGAESNEGEERLPAVTDEELVRKSKEDDERAFGELVSRYESKVYSLALRMVRNPEDAEDVLQDTFLRAYRGIKSFQGASTFSTWIYRITINECLNQQRGRGAQHIPLEALLGSNEEHNPGAAADLEHGESEPRDIIHRAVMELSPKLRAVVALKYLEGLSYEEIASVLECSPGTVASRLNRALRELESRLRPLRRLL